MATYSRRRRRSRSPSRSGSRSDDSRRISNRLVRTVTTLTSMSTIEIPAAQPPTGPAPAVQPPAGPTLEEAGPVDGPRLILSRSTDSSSKSRGMPWMRSLENVAPYWAAVAKYYMTFCVRPLVRELLPQYLLTRLMKNSLRTIN